MQAQAQVPVEEPADDVQTQKRKRSKAYMEYKKMLLKLSWLGTIGGALMAGMFFLNNMDITIMTDGYHASLFNLAHWDIIRNYDGHEVHLRTGYEILFGVLILGLISIPLSFPRDGLARGGALGCGAVGLFCLVAGYLDFTEYDSSWLVRPAYGFYITVIAGIIIVVTNGYALYLILMRERKKKRWFREKYGDDEEDKDDANDDWEED